MSIDELKIGNVVKFLFRERKIAATVIFITDYNTVNVVPYSLKPTIKNVWSIPIDSIIDIVDIDTISRDDLQKFLFDVQEVATKITAEKHVDKPVTIN